MEEYQGAGTPRDFAHIHCNKAAAQVEKPAPANFKPRLKANNSLYWSTILTKTNISQTKKTPCLQMNTNYQHDT